MGGGGRGKNLNQTRSMQHIDESNALFGIYSSCSRKGQTNCIKSQVDIAMSVCPSSCSRKGQFV